MTVTATGPNRDSGVESWRDDGDHDIYVFREIGDEEREQITYDDEPGAVLWQYRKGVSSKFTFISEERGIEVESEFEESEERHVTTTGPPIIWT